MLGQIPSAASSYMVVIVAHWFAPVVASESPHRGKKFGGWGGGEKDCEWQSILHMISHFYIQCTGGPRQVRT